MTEPRRASNSSLPAPTKRLKPRSAKRTKQERLYSALRAGYLAEFPWCARCGQQATEIHHKAGRRGDLLLDVDLWVSLCHADHVYVTEHPRLALAEGLSLPRTWTA